MLGRFARYTYDTTTGIFVCGTCRLNSTDPKVFYNHVCEGRIDPPPIPKPVMPKVVPKAAVRPKPQPAPVSKVMKQPPKPAPKPTLMTKKVPPKPGRA